MWANLKGTTANERATLADQETLEPLKCSYNVTIGKNAACKCLIRLHKFPRNLCYTVVVQ